jgi:hypothetical protein
MRWVWPAEPERKIEESIMFDRWFGTVTEVIAAAAAAGAIFYLGYEINRRQKRLRDLFFVLGPDSAVMAEHLEELARRGAIRPYQGTAAG